MKKVLFFVITILMGFMLMLTSYQGFYMSNVQGIIQGSLDNKEYDNLAKSFLPFYNKEEVNHDCTEGKYDIITYEALVGEKVKVKFEGKEVETDRYQEALVLFVDDIDFVLDGVKEGDKVNNYTNVTLYNGDKKLVYYFNDPIDAANSNAEGVKRYYTDAASNLKFVMLTISKLQIDTALDGKVTKMEVYDGHNDLVGSVNCDLDFDSQFYTDAGKIVTEYDKYLKEPENEEIKKAYAEFYQRWYDEYVKNENYGIAYQKGEISNTGVILKTVGIMSAYLLICIALGYFILRKKPTLAEQVRKSGPTTYRTTDFRTKKVSEVSEKDIKKEKTETKGEVLSSDENKKDDLNLVSKNENVEELGEDSTKEN